MKTFINVAQMKLASLKEGQFVETGGYYTKGDAGQAKYLIVAAQAADGYGDHTLANGTVAVLQSSGETNVKQFGATGNNVADDTMAIQAAIDYTPNAGKVVILKDAVYTNDVDWKGREHETADLPFLLNSVAQTGGNLSAGMTVSNGQLYVTNFVDNTINVYGLSDPRRPQIAFSFGCSSNPRWVEVIGRIVIVACNLGARLEFYDTSNPQSVSLIGYIDTGGRPKQFVVDGDLIYLVCATTSVLQKYRFALPFEGSPFKIDLLKEVSVSSEPLHLSLNGDGIIAVGGFSTANIDIFGADNLNLIHSSAIGGVEHSSCEWVNKSLLAVLDATNGTLIMVSYGVLTSPNIRSTTNTIDNPSQIEIIGNRLYTMSLTGAGVQAKLAAFDITAAEFPTEYKQVDLTVEGAGFSSYHQVGNVGYVYVNGHSVPFNIDVVEVVSGESRNDRYKDKDQSAHFGSVSIADLEVEKLKATVNKLKQDNITKTNAYSIQESDNIVRCGSGSGFTVTLPDPELDEFLDRQITIKNVHNTSSTVIANAFGGFSGTLAPKASVILVAMNFGVDFSWDVIASHGTIT